MSTANDTGNSKPLGALGALVLFLAVPVLWSWLAVPSAGPATAALRDKAARGIASVAAFAGEEPSKSKLSRPVTLDWNLAGPGFAREIEGTHLRLKGQVQGFKADSIVNQSNGFTASVFLTGAEFTTDFIELKEGLNDIQVQVESADGDKVLKKIEVTRRSPSSQGPPAQNE